MIIRWPKLPKFVICSNHISWSRIKSCFQIKSFVLQSNQHVIQSWFRSWFEFAHHWHAVTIAVPSVSLFHFVTMSPCDNVSMSAVWLIIDQPWHTGKASPANVISCLIEKYSFVSWTRFRKYVVFFQLIFIFLYINFVYELFNSDKKALFWLECTAVF